MLWLHEKGYNFFNIPLLTYPEIFSLLDAAERRSKEEKRKMEAEKRKAESKRSRKR